MSESGLERRLKSAIERELLLGRLGEASGSFSRVVHSRANVVVQPLATLSSEEEAKLKAFAERLVSKAIQDVASGKA